MKAAAPSRWHHSLLRLYLHYFTLALPSLLLVGSLTACSTQTISTTAFTQLTAETGKINENSKSNLHRSEAAAALIVSLSQ